MNRKIGFALLLLVLFAISFAGGCASGGGQPHMKAALDHLRAARSELQAASTDKGGHRGAAIGLIDDAIAQVERGMEYARTH